MVDILADQKPFHCASMICIGVSEADAPGLCKMMDNCWHKDPTFRPSILSSICQYLQEVYTSKLPEIYSVPVSPRRI